MAYHTSLSLCQIIWLVSWSNWHSDSQWSNKRCVFIVNRNSNTQVCNLGERWVELQSEICGQTAAARLFRFVPAWNCFVSLHIYDRCRIHLKHAKNDCKTFIFVVEALEPNIWWQKLLGTPSSSESAIVAPHAQVVHRSLFLGSGRLA